VLIDGQAYLEPPSDHDLVTTIRAVLARNPQFSSQVTKATRERQTRIATRTTLAIMRA